MFHPHAVEAESIPPAPNWFRAVPPAPSWFHSSSSEPAFEAEPSGPRRFQRLIPVAAAVVRRSLAALLFLGACGVLAYSLIAPVGRGDAPRPASSARLAAFALGEKEAAPRSGLVPAAALAGTGLQRPLGSLAERTRHAGPLSRAIAGAAAPAEVEPEQTTFQVAVAVAKRPSSAIVASPPSSDGRPAHNRSPSVSNSQSAPDEPIPTETVGRSQDRARIDVTETVAALERGVPALVPRLPVRHITADDESNGHTSHGRSRSPTTGCRDGTCSTEATPSTAERRLGTVVNWAKSPNRAGELAKEQQRLVFLIQVSGNFAREEFT